MKNIHIVPDTKNNCWCIKEEKGDCIGIANTKHEARSIARKVAREHDTYLIFHNKDGRFGLR